MDMLLDAKLDSVLSELSDGAKSALKKELQKSVKRSVKKKIKKRRKRLVRTIVVIGLAAGAGYLVYTHSEKVKKTIDDAVDTVTSKLPIQPAEAVTKVKAVIRK